MGYNTFDLRYAQNDVKLIRNALRMHGFAIITPKQSSAPPETKATLVSLLDDFLDSCGSSDTALIYFSGHAFAPKGELLLLLDDDLKRLNASTIRLSYLISAIENCSARNKLFILDCCHALSEISDWRPPQSEAYRILTASGRLEKAKEIDSLRSSFLTYQIYRALTECYSEITQDGVYLTVNSLYKWILAQTKKYNIDHSESVPIPKLIGDVGNDFTLCSLRDRVLPIQITKYLSQISYCFSGCNRECFGRFPWCRVTSELGLINSYYVIPRIRYSKDGGIISTQRLDVFFSRNG